MPTARSMDPVRLVPALITALLWAYIMGLGAIALYQMNVHTATGEELGNGGAFMFWGWILGVGVLLLMWWLHLGYTIFYLGHELATWRWANGQRLSFWFFTSGVYVAVALLLGMMFTNMDPNDAFLMSKMRRVYGVIVIAASVLSMQGGFFAVIPYLFARATLVGEGGATEVPGSATSSVRHDWALRIPPSLLSTVLWAWILVLAAVALAQLSVHVGTGVELTGRASAMFYLWTIGTGALLALVMLYSAYLWFGAHARYAADHMDVPLVYAMRMGPMLATTGLYIATSVLLAAMFTDSDPEKAFAYARMRKAYGILPISALAAIMGGFSVSSTYMYSSRELFPPEGASALRPHGAEHEAQIKKKAGMA